jgi:hypothetical protein
LREINAGMQPRRQAATQDEPSGKINDMDENKAGNRRTFTEEIELAGNELVERIKALLAEGNVRQLRLKARDGDVVLEAPLTIGVVAGGAVVLAAPWLAILGAIAALLTNVTLEVVRDVDDKGDGGGTTSA